MVDSLEWALPSKLPPITLATASQPNIKENLCGHMRTNTAINTNTNTNLEWALPSKLPPFNTPATAAQPNIKDFFADKYYY